MKIIDWERKGNVVRFYLGQDTLTTWGGDDWDDAPYEHNAGKVYDKYISGQIDIAFGFDSTVEEPADICANSKYSKDDFIKRKAPFLTISHKRYKKEFYLGDDWNILNNLN